MKTETRNEPTLRTLSTNVCNGNLVWSSFELVESFVALNFIFLARVIRILEKEKIYSIYIHPIYVSMFVIYVSKLRKCIKLAMYLVFQVSVFELRLCKVQAANRVWVAVAKFLRRKSCSGLFLLNRIWYLRWFVRQLRDQELLVLFTIYWVCSI